MRWECDCPKGVKHFFRPPSPDDGPGQPTGILVTLPDGSAMPCLTARELLLPESVEAAASEWAKGVVESSKAKHPAGPLGEPVIWHNPSPAQIKSLPAGLRRFAEVGIYTSTATGRPDDGAEIVQSYMVVSRDWFIIYEGTKFKSAFLRGQSIGVKALAAEVF